jgi:hypothetical protein
MEREKDVFEIEIQMQKFQSKARNELKEVTYKREVKTLLEKLKKLEMEHFEKIRQDLDDEKLQEKAERLLKETEAARDQLEEGQLYKLRDYLREIKEIIDNSEFCFPDDKSRHTSYLFARNALSAVNDIIDYEEGKKDPEEELEGHTEELLQRIESADEQEIRQIQGKLESDSLEDGFEEDIEEKCRKIWKETDEARKNLQDGNYGEALEYVEEVGEILDAVQVELEHINRLENQFEIDKENPINKNHVYPLKNRNDLLIKFNVSLRDSKKLKKLIDQMPEDVNIAKIVEVGMYEGEPAQIIKRAPGKQIRHADDPDRLMSEIADAPQEHFDKLVRDSELMAKYGLTPDASDNLFYSREKGFIWIDPLIYNITERAEKGLDNDRFNYFGQVVPKGQASSEADRERARKIVYKLEKAGALESGKSLEKALSKFLEDSSPDLPDYVKE